MKIKKSLILLSIFIIAGLLMAQHLPSPDDEMPWSGQQSTDSLAAVNARITADSLRLDSLRAVLGDSIQENTNLIDALPTFAETGAVVKDSMGGATSTELGYSSGVTSDIQDQIDAAGGGAISDSLVGIRGRSFNIVEFFPWNVVQLMAASRDDSTHYTNWSDDCWGFAGGTHTDNTTQHKTDRWAVTATMTNNTDGIDLDFTNTNLAQTLAQDTLADWYCTFNIYILTQDIADLNDANGLGIAFFCDAHGDQTNYYYYKIDDSELSNGWNRLAITKSSFGEIGSPNWNAVKGFGVFVAPVPDAEVVLTIDALQLVRPAAGSAEPNWAQHEGPDGTWVEDLTQEGTGLSLFEESGQLGIMTLEAAVTTAYMKSVASFGDYNASGISYGGPTNGNVTPLYYSTVVNRSIAALNNNLVKIIDADNNVFSTALTTVADADVFWEFNRAGTVVTFSATYGGPYTTVTATGGAAATQIILNPEPEQRIRSFSLSTVKYAQRAGLSGGFTVPLGNIGKYHIGSGTLEIYVTADSSYFTPGDTVRAR